MNSANTAELTCGIVQIQGGGHEQLQPQQRPELDHFQHLKSVHTELRSLVIPKDYKSVSSSAFVHSGEDPWTHLDEMKQWLTTEPMRELRKNLSFSDD